MVEIADGWVGDRDDDEVDQPADPWPTTTTTDAAWLRKHYSASNRMHISR